MTPEELYTALAGTGIPTAYRAFPAPQATPFICYYSEEEPALPADGKRYHTWHRYVIELYTDQKDTAKEAIVEAALGDRVFSKAETYIDEEKMTEIIYTMEG